MKGATAAAAAAAATTTTTAVPTTQVKPETAATVAIRYRCRQSVGCDTEATKKGPSAPSKKPPARIVSALAPVIRAPDSTVRSALPHSPPPPQSLCAAATSAQMQRVRDCVVLAAAGSAKAASTPQPTWAALSESVNSTAMVVVVSASQRWRRAPSPCKWTQANSKRPTARRTVRRTKMRTGTAGRW